MADAPRRFPPPWRGDKIQGGYVVRDANGQALAYIYSRETDVEALQAKVLTKDAADRHQHRAAAGAAREGRAHGLSSRARQLHSSWGRDHGGREISISRRYLRSNDVTAMIHAGAEASTGDDGATSTSTGF
jgi:hypothetical protein